MNITDQFRVDVPVEQAWAVLLDVERIAPCMPGAQLESSDGDEYRGGVKVKVGPITAQYKGVARILEADETARRIVLRAEGRDTRGQGNASATVTASLAPDGTGTLVNVDTDLNVSGKVAQFGRGVMADVSAKLLAQFVACLHDKVLSGDAASPGGTAGGDALRSSAGGQSSLQASPPVAGSTGDEVAAPERANDEPEAIDLMKVAGGAVAKRLVPVLAGGLVVVGVVVWLLTR